MLVWYGDETEERTDEGEAVLLSYRKEEAQRLDTRLYHALRLVHSMCQVDAGRKAEWEDLRGLIVGYHTSLIVALNMGSAEAEE